MDKQNPSDSRTLSCSGNLGLYCWLHKVDGATPGELASIFHEKAELVRQYAAKIFDDVEEDAEVGEMWDSETCEELDEKEYYEC